MRDTIKLTCANCNRANYHTTKNKRTMTENFLKLAAADYATCGRRANGTMSCWGNV